MAGDLKPCPFCGGKVKITNIKDYDNEDFYMVYCEECPASTCFGTESFTKEGAVEAWNRRVKE